MIVLLSLQSLVEKESVDWVTLAILEVLKLWFHLTSVDGAHLREHANGKRKTKDKRDDTNSRFNWKCKSGEAFEDGGFVD
eukprot:m.20296 g.20296  ORF g.20296 m.20296 type:complete len:80 (-) comp5235_c0_seq1:930-1169(-)